MIETTMLTNRGIVDTTKAVDTSKGRREGFRFRQDIRRRSPLRPQRMFRRRPLPGKSTVEAQAAEKKDTAEECRFRGYFREHRSTFPSSPVRRQRRVRESGKMLKGQRLTEHSGHQSMIPSRRRLRLGSGLEAIQQAAARSRPSACMFLKRRAEMGGEDIDASLSRG